MQSVIGAVAGWIRDGDPFVAFATVVRVYHAAPRQAGAVMAVSIRGEIAGSVSGGCVEGEVADVAREVLLDGRSRCLDMGITDDLAWATGLTCGGAIEIWVDRVAGVTVSRMLDAFETDEPTVSLIALREGSAGEAHRALVGAQSQWFCEGWPIARATVTNTVGPLLDAGSRANPVISDETDDEGGALRLFADPWPGRPTVTIFGAVHIAQALVDLAHRVGYATVVVDPRATFSTDERVGHAGRVVRRWPQDAITSGEVVLDSRSFVVVLTHDPKLDEPALATALRTNVPYIGCLGSKKTQESRRERLRRDGFDEAALTRIRGPVGLDLGARNPEEIALGIMAEIVAVARGSRLA